MNHIDWQRSKDVALGIALETAGRALGWLIWLVGAWLALAVIVGSVVIAVWIGDRL